MHRTAIQHIELMEPRVVSRPNAFHAEPKAIAPRQRTAFKIEAFRFERGSPLRRPETKRPTCKARGDSTTKF